MSDWDGTKLVETNLEIIGVGMTYCEKWLCDLTIKIALLHFLLISNIFIILYQEQQIIKIWNSVANYDMQPLFSRGHADIIDELSLQQENDIFLTF